MDQLLLGVFGCAHQHQKIAVGKFGLHAVFTHQNSNFFPRATAFCGINDNFKRLTLRHDPAVSTKHRANARQAGRRIGQALGIPIGKIGIAQIQGLHNEIRGAGRGKERERVPGACKILLGGILSNMQIRAAR